MEPLYGARVSLKVGDSVCGTWALPTWEHVSVGRLPSSGVHIPNSWVPSRLCRFIPYEMGWLVQLGRARAKVESKYLPGLVFRGRSIVALQAGRTLVGFPELDDHCTLRVVIGAGQDEGLEVVQDKGDAEGDVPRTRFAVGRVELTDHQRTVAAVTFEHLLTGAMPPHNLAAAAAPRLGMSEQGVKNALNKVRDKVNDERWLNLQTSEQLGHYLILLSRNVTWDDLPSKG